MKITYSGLIYQWDQGISLAVDTTGMVAEADGVFRIHFARKCPDMILAVEIAGGYAIIPGEVLQSAGHFVAYGYYYDSDSQKTIMAERFEIVARPKPPEYILIPTPVITYPELVDLVNNLTELEQALTPYKKLKIIEVNRLADLDPDQFIAMGQAGDVPLVKYVVRQYNTGGDIFHTFYLLCVGFSWVTPNKAYLVNLANSNALTEFILSGNDKGRLVNRVYVKTTDIRPQVMPNDDQPVSSRAVIGYYNGTIKPYVNDTVYAAPVLLWENTNQAAGMENNFVVQFAASPHPVSALMVEFVMTSTSVERLTFWLPNESFTAAQRRYNVTWDYGAFSATGLPRGRQIKACVKDTSMTFGDGYEGGTANPKRMIPLKIWGLK